MTIRCRADKEYVLSELSELFVTHTGIVKAAMIVTKSNKFEAMELIAKSTNFSIEQIYNMIIANT